MVSQRNVSYASSSYVPHQRVTRDFLLFSMTFKALTVMFAFPYLDPKTDQKLLPRAPAIFSSFTLKETSRLLPPAAKESLGSAPNCTMEQHRHILLQVTVMKTEGLVETQTLSLARPLTNQNCILGDCCSV